MRIGQAGQKRNIDDHRRFDAAVLPGTAYTDEVLQGLGVAIPGGFRMFDSVYRLPEKLLQFCAADFEYPLVENRENLRFIGPILPVRHRGGELPAWLKGLDGSRAVVLATRGTPFCGDCKNPTWHHHSANGKRIMDMKCARDFLFLAGFLISACSQPDPQTAKLQRFYAEKGEEMTPMINKVEQRNPQQGTTPSLSTTNAPIRN